jgi:hypothetical protein
MILTISGNGATAGKLQISERGIESFQQAYHPASLLTGIISPRHKPLALRVSSRALVPSATMVPMPVIPITAIMVTHHPGFRTVPPAGLITAGVRIARSVILAIRVRVKLRAVAWIGNYRLPRSRRNSCDK